MKEMEVYDKGITGENLVIMHRGLPASSFMLMVFHVILQCI